MVIAWTSEGLKVVEGPDPNPETLRIVPSYWAQVLGVGAVIGEELAFALASDSRPVERVA